MQDPPSSEMFRNSTEVVASVLHFCREQQCSPSELEKLSVHQGRFCSHSFFLLVKNIGVCSCTLLYFSILPACALQICQEPQQSPQRWEAVNEVPGAFVVNIGDMLERWTNGKWKSTLHRVILPEGLSRDRYSVPFFFEPNFECLVECLPSCTSPDEPPRCASPADPCSAVRGAYEKAHTACLPPLCPTLSAEWGASCTSLGKPPSQISSLRFLGATVVYLMAMDNRCVCVYMPCSTRE